MPSGPKPRPLSERFWDRIGARGIDDCWEWPGARLPRGYGRIGLGGRPGSVGLAHRVSWELSCGPVPEGLSVLHRCDNPPCVNPAHLFVGTQADNVADQVAKGRKPRGESCSHSVLTEQSVREIRLSQESDPALGRYYGVTRETIRDIRRGKIWRHVEGA